VPLYSQGLTSWQVPVICDEILFNQICKRRVFMKKRVLVPVAQGTEEMEAITIIDVLRRAGADVIVASVDEMTIKAARGIEFKADVLIKDCMETEFDLIVLPGGIPGAQNLKHSKELEILLKKQAGQKKYYAAICASPAVVLHPYGLVTPGHVTCHPGFGKMIDNGNIVDAPVVVDGNCITSRGAGTACDFALQLVALLYSDDRKKEVMQGLALEVD
jgi:4-methyl-5(b-hydroxyethyl)-thiazole monophosphate biosynthesis